MKIKQSPAQILFKGHLKFWEGSWEVKDDIIRGGLLTRTKVNVKQVRQVLCGDRRLTFWMITSQLDMKKKNDW